MASDVTHVFNDTEKGWQTEIVLPVDDQVAKSVIIRRRFDGEIVAEITVPYAAMKGFAVRLMRNIAIGRIKAMSDDKFLLDLSI